jgi:hypothetical protein
VISTSCISHTDVANADIVGANICPFSRPERGQAIMGIISSNTNTKKKENRQQQRHRNLFDVINKGGFMFLHDEFDSISDLITHMDGLM